MTEHYVAAASELREKKRILCDVGGQSVLLIDRADGIIAIENACTHLGLPLHEGRIIAGQIHCPHHGACFDLATGAAISGPAVSAIKRFEVSIRDNDIYVVFDEEHVQLLTKGHNN